MPQTSPDGLMAPSGGGDDFRRPAAAPDALLPRWGTREFNVDSLVAALTQIFAGNLTLGAKLLFTTAASLLVPGATSFSFRNNADSATNVSITDAGLVTVARSNLALTLGNLIFGAASAKVIPGATSLLIRDNGDANTNLSILDNGNVTARGNLAGVAGTFSGAVSGTTGTFTGAVTTTAVLAPSNGAAVAADGAITITAANKTYFITKAGVAAMTIVDPTATTHDFVTLSFVAATANAHTLSNAVGSGFFSSGGSSKDVATFGGAIGDGLTIIAYQGKWYIDPRGVTNITLG
jgi:hypothetical protein